MSRLEKIKIWSEEKKQKNIIAGEKQKGKKKNQFAHFSNSEQVRLEM